MMGEGEAKCVERYYYQLNKGNNVDNHLSAHFS